MTTTPPADDTTDDDRVDLSRTGWVRFTIGDRTLRLRRPFLGELRVLRTALENVIDEIQFDSARAQDVLDQIKAEREAVDAEASDRIDKLVDLRARERKATRDLDEKVSTLRLGWWLSVFAKLEVNGQTVEEDDEWPVWFTDDSLPGVVLVHWRSVPLDRG